MFLNPNIFIFESTAYPNKYMIACVGMNCRAYGHNIYLDKDSDFSKLGACPHISSLSEDEKALIKLLISR